MSKQIGLDQFVSSQKKAGDFPSFWCKTKARFCEDQTNT
jgi:hypothetical protein